MNINDYFAKLDELYGQSDMQLIEKYLKDGLAQSKAEQQADIAFSILNELIGFYRCASQYEIAYKYGQQAISYAEQLGITKSVDYATTLLNIATVYRAGGEIDKAQVYYQEVEEIYQVTLAPNDARFSGLYNNLALFYKEVKQLDKAISYLQKSLEIIEIYQEGLFEKATILTNLGILFMQQNDYERANRYISQALECYLVICRYRP